MINVIPAGDGITVTATGPARHQCPHVNETDDGTITVAWTCTGGTIELHSLAAYLATYHDTRIDHETYVEAIRNDIRDHAGDLITDVTVTATFTTVDLTVQATAP